jgi:hypothetical protein
MTIAGHNSSDAVKQIVMSVPILLFNAMLDVSMLPFWTYKTG